MHKLNLIIEINNNNNNKWIPVCFHQRFSFFCVCFFFSPFEIIENPSGIRKSVLWSQVNKKKIHWTIVFLRCWLSVDYYWHIVHLRATDKIQQQIIKKKLFSDYKFDFFLYELFSILLHNGKQKGKTNNQFLSEKRERKTNIFSAPAQQQRLPVNRKIDCEKRKLVLIERLFSLLCLVG